LPGKRLPDSSYRDLSVQTLILRKNPLKTLIFIVKPPYLAPQSFRPYIVNGSLRARKFVMTFF
ncbi:TPA: hypothetical protein ACIART_004028, partial [Salmonella enterica subsp. enterica serovar Chailey]